MVAAYLLLQRKDAGQREHDLRAVLRLVAGRQAEPSAMILGSRTLRSTPESPSRNHESRARRRTRIMAEAA